METKLQTYYEALNQQVEQQLQGPVIVAGVYHHAGVVSSMVLHKVSPLLALLKRRGDKEKAGGLPKQMILALTNDHVIVFTAKPHRGGLQLGERVAWWARADVQVLSTKDGSLYRRLVLQVPDRTIELDGTKDEVAHRIEAELSR
jgi:hypothetical protein